MIRWVTNWPSSALPKWQSRHWAARAARILERHQAARDVGARGCRRPHNGSASQPEAGPWQLSQPTPSEVWKRAPRRPAGVAWQPRHIGAVDGSPMPSRWRDRARPRLAQHRPGAAVGAGGGRRILPEHELVLADDRRRRPRCGRGRWCRRRWRRRHRWRCRCRSGRAPARRAGRAAGGGRARRASRRRPARSRCCGCPPIRPPCRLLVRSKKCLKLWAERHLPCNPQRGAASP